MGISKQVISGTAMAIGFGAVALTGYASEAASVEARARLASFLSVLTNAEEHRTEARGGYELTVHPGFSSRASVQVEGRAEQELYRQQGIYNLPAGQTAPPSRHAIRLTGGEHARDVGVVVNDPKHQVARVIIELYDENHTPGSREAGKIIERVVVDNNGTTCPPDCGEEPPANRSSQQ